MVSIAICCRAVWFVAIKGLYILIGIGSLPLHPPGAVAACQF
jgi:hypothetical protein